MFCTGDNLNPVIQIQIQSKKFLKNIHYIFIDMSMGEQSQRTPQAIVGEKPFCQRHSTKLVEFICTAKECSYRILCLNCQSEHEKSCVNHKPLVVNINDWYKEFNSSLKDLFDPAGNTAILYLMDKATYTLNKQREVLNESQSKMTEAFQKALKELLETFQSMNEEMNSLLWKNQKLQEEALAKAKSKLEQMSYKNCKKQIYELMKAELTMNFEAGTLETFYSKVYNGEYCNQVFDRYGGVKSLQSELKDLRQEIDKGFLQFDQKKFEETWENELKGLRTFMKDDSIFQRVVIDDINSRGGKVRMIEDQPSSERCPKIVCQLNIPTASTTLSASLSKDLLITASTTKIVSVWDVSHNYRKVSEIDQSNDEDDDIRVKSVCTFEYCQKTNTYTHHHLLLMGGDDECPHIEVWEYGTNKFLTVLENAHENGISCIQELKRQYSQTDNSCTFYIATAACDNLIKIWTLHVSGNSQQSGLDITMKLFRESHAHSAFVSCLVSLPKCSSTEEDGSVLISGSHDKSINFWNWEDNQSDARAERALLGEEDDKESEECTHEDDQTEFKIKCAHSDFVKAIALLSHQEDSEDLDSFASGGGDNMIKIWSLRDKKLIKAFSNNKRPVSKMVSLGRGKLASSANEKHIKEFHVYIWDWRSAQLLAALKDHKTLVNNIITLKDGTLLTSDNKCTKIWKLEYNSSSQKKQSKHSPQPIEIVRTSSTLSSEGSATLTLCN